MESERAFVRQTLHSRISKRVWNLDETQILIFEIRRVDRIFLLSTCESD